MLKSRPSKLFPLALVLFLTAGLTLVATPAQAVVSWNLRPLTWDDIGLDSNDETVGPNVYEVGVRACNTGTTTATTVTGTWAWTNIGATRTGTAITSPPGPYVDIQTGTSAVETTNNLVAGACYDFYYNMEIDRDPNVYKTTRDYTLTVTDGTVSATKSSRIAIMDLQSQNRNYVAGAHCAGNPDGSGDCGIYGSWNAGTTSWNAAPTTVYVGGTYIYTLVSTTATGGYGSYSTMLNFPRGIFQLQAPSSDGVCNLQPPTLIPPNCSAYAATGYPVQQTYSAFPAAPWCNPGPCPPASPNLQIGGCCRDVPPNVNGTTRTVWANACNWQYDNTFPKDPVNDDCTAGAEKNYKAGNDTVTTFTVKILAAGTGSITGLVWDGSGASWHYNADYGDEVVSITALSPTDANFESASAVATPEGDALTWKTGFEADNLGFNVFGTSPTAGEVRVNDALIAGSALSAGGDAAAGRTYHWLVPSGVAGGPYRIEAVDLNGDTDSSTYITVQGSREAAAPRDSALLTDLRGASHDAVFASRVAKPRTVGPLDPSTDAAVIEVDHEGWYSVPLTDLAAAGIDTSRPKRLHVTAEGTEQPVVVRGESLQFYGLGLDTPQTDTRAYIVEAGATLSPKVPMSTAPTGPDAPESYLATVTKEDRSIYFSSLINGTESNFFGTPVTAAPSDQTIALDSPAASSGRLEVRLQGVTGGAHDVAVDVNGASVGSVHLSGTGQGTLVKKNVSIQAGDNTVTMTSSGALDVSLTDSISFTYPRERSAVDGALSSTAPAGQRVTVTNLDTEDARIVDVTAPNAPIELPTDTVADGGAFAASATAPTGGGTRTLLAFSEPESPAAVRSLNTGGLAGSSNGADMLIVTNDDLAPSMDPLAGFHDEQGLETTVVNIDEIYDAFGAGEASPQAVRSFLDFTQSGWDEAPSYVLLGGDASLDPRGFQGPDGPAADIVPTKLVDTRFMETASDPWLLSSKTRSNVALGRLPVRTPEEATAMVDKTIAYADAPLSDDYLMATDISDGGFDFSKAAGDAADAAPDGTQVTEVNSGEADAHNKLITAINDEPSVLDYLGHGSITFWRGGTFSTNDVPSLTNTEHPTFFVAMTCLNGYFVAPNVDSLAEAMVKAPGGAVASWASTGQTYPRPQARMNEALFANLDDAPTIGVAVQRATESINDKDVRATWVLLGDPALELR